MTLLPIPLLKKSTPQRMMLPPTVRFDCEDVFPRAEGLTFSPSQTSCPNRSNLFHVITELETKSILLLCR